jgi:altronate dehydratase
VPTLKFVSTTARFELLRHEMDVDAGRYLTGAPLTELTGDAFDLTVRTASGERTAGERAGHSQVSIWRDWKQTRPIVVTPEATDALLPGLPVPAGVEPGPARALPLLAADGRTVPEHVALILPTSLCSGQVALRLADQASRESWLGDAVSRVVALPHTEGCGASAGPSEETFARLMVGYLTHPNVRLALLLEHGCEKTHNDYFRARLVAAGADPAGFGWAGIQRDGGIAAATERVRAWFTSADLAAPVRVDGTIGDLTVGLDARGPLTDTTAEALAAVGHQIVAAGGTVMLPSRSALLGRLGTPGPTLAHGQRAVAPGLHVMRTPGTDWLETATGLGASGAQVLLTHVSGGTLSGSRLVPLIQVSTDQLSDVDEQLSGDVDEQAQCVLDTLVAVAARERVPRALAVGNVGFQVTRGLLGTSM